MFMAVSFLVGFVAWSAFQFADRRFSPLYSGLRL